ncbi:HPF/RaiA family ribosome-associated protein [Aquabacterium sp. J223]|uniref:HPF/RaiA family ribosome-associated protein n=1 Tax=Aquabacterium sp. J223 TaxID=2898431 RepID=UPI0021AD6054|nr:HPF/RaiA family ribosome-associated protein [Aquabacterium sp. J223]UUX95136.1 HPF/RaiA family ribosome-associated protein [Aquabacterium sp. J223]
MDVIFESRDPQGQALRDVAERRLRFSLRRLAWWVARATVRLSDVDGPRRGADKRCQVELQPVGGPVVVVTSLAADWRSSLEQAVSRSARALLRAHRRTFHHGRQSLA